MNDVIISQIKYIDYRRERIPEDNFMKIFCYKRNHFDFERELRVWFIEREKQTKGIKRKINPGDLIEEIYIAPSAKDDLRHRIQALLQANGLTTPIKQSPLDDKPLY